MILSIINWSNISNINILSQSCQSLLNWVWFAEVASSLTNIFGLAWVVFLPSSFGDW